MIGGSPKTLHNVSKEKVVDDWSERGRGGR